ncbi:MAG TPA: acetate--CoA ligase family protein [Candidatus Methylomirabilis sp.]|nr:acetate--CoA ligase family protein [Candidatus Methylomirabilis sp.]
MRGTQADFTTTKDLLKSFGISIIGTSVRTREDAVATATEIGFPCVMKLISPDVIHKTDAGLVILDIQSPSTAGKSYDRIVANGRKAGAQRLDGVLVQKQAKPGFELLLGARQDPVFGPVTMIGYGGRYVELFKEVAPGVGVLTRADVERMLSETVVSRVIAGFRGPALDKDAVIDLTIRVSQLMEARPEVTELDLNPVILYPRGCCIVDARMIVGEPIIHPRAVHLSETRLRSLKAIFEAKSVAVVGASSPGSIGGIILKNSSRVERLYPINPKRDTLMGLKCYKGFHDLPTPADVAVFAVAPETTIASFRQFCETGGKGAIVVSDGFAEIGRSDLEDELRAISEQHGVVYIGPNCLGVFDNFSGLNTLFLPMRRLNTNTKPGLVGVVSQSGGVGLELLEMAAADNLAIGKWVSCGNASGISIPELLAHMGDDRRIRVIAIYVEGLRNGLQFMEVGRKIAKRKPVIVIKGGMAGGAAATMSHTASLAGSFQAFQAACHQAGFYLIEELTEDPKILINVLSILTTQKPARNNRVAVVSVGGGAAILLADQITSNGMQLTTFTEDTQARLARLLGSKIRAASDADRARIADRVASNPLDLFGDADDDRLLEAIRILNDDLNTDVIVVGLYFQVPYLSEYIAERLVEVMREMRKPLILSARGYSHFVQQTTEYLAQNDVHTYTVPMIKPLAIALDIWKRYDLDFTA